MGQGRVPSASAACVKTATARTSEPKSKDALERVSVVLPAHNEEHNIVEAVRRALAAAEQVSDRQEVIVVDDGSRDATGALAAGLAARDARVRLVTHERNRGYGSTVRSGIRAARMDWG